jgi:transcription-repair coupling factor (superfamily II helicase)
MIINQLNGSALAFTLSSFLKEKEGLSIVLTRTPNEAYDLEAALRFFSPALQTEHFPDLETLPYDLISPHQSVISDRLKCLSGLYKNEKKVIFASVVSLMHLLSPINFIEKYHFEYQCRDKVNISEFRKRLERSGYRFTNKVMEHGECAFRGGIIDIFPMGSNQPFRIDLFDDEIESIRLFSADTQQSIEKVNKISLLPAREFPFDKDAITTFRKAWREAFPGNPANCPVYTDVSNGIMPAGIEYYLPFFFSTCNHFFDYLPKETDLYLIDDISSACTHFLEDVKSRYQQRSSDITRPILPPEKIFLSKENFFHQIKKFNCITLNQEKKQKYNANIGTPPKLQIDRKDNQPLKLLEGYLLTHKDKKNLILAESAGRREVLLDLLEESHISPKRVENWQTFRECDYQIAITEGPLTKGAELLDENINIIVESQLFNNRSVAQKRQKGVNPDLIIKDLTELKLHAPVVHIEHGVGRYRGLELIKTQNQENEFLLLEYAEKAKIYVPVTSLHLISRYTGGEMEHAPLHRLGTASWQKEKKKAITQISDVACELLDIYAKRKAQKGHAYIHSSKDFNAFSATFPFEETLDQKRAISEIVTDMCQEQPMDRLVCGDVGFGKTEVAMRAAFLAIQNDKQVCVLVPTTLLAGQHFETFSDRFADFPVRVDFISRFRTKKEVDGVINDLKFGKIDILIGTHKLFQKSIQFKDLGLLIVDEEHRFGVKQKEHIKSIKHNIEILSLTATPIPRTLNMSMSGMQDISIIATPPAKRLSIKTFNYEKVDVVIKDALTRELLRGGQVFYLHNNVETIQHIANELAELVPEAKIEIAHGQMRERQLEKVMNDFYHHKFNVLVCTTIIETGIDIPTANTIIIDRADKFGLAQLHQLRGRVGRGNHQAYAYLLTPNQKALTPDAIKRLDALMSMHDLGAGFTLATHDLEIRGAGELLGEDQSGNMHTLGFTLYMTLLERAVKAIKSGKQPELSGELDVGPEINLQISTIIPEAFIGDIHTRLTFYKRIANANSDNELKALKIELIDRFGLLPPTVKDLFSITSLKLIASKCDIQKIISNEQGCKIFFNESTTIKPEAILHLIQIHATRFKLKGPNRIWLEIEDKKEQLNTISDFLKQLSLDNCFICKRAFKLR